jgi:hypothetical protein
MYLGANGGPFGSTECRHIFLSSWQHELSLPYPRLSVVGEDEVGRADCRPKSVQSRGLFESF